MNTGHENKKKSGTRPIRVVVVDDSPTVRQLLVAILQGADQIDVIGVGTNGEEAVRLTRRMQPDVLTMDVRMPKMDGLEATRHIMREAPTPIIIVTGNLMHADIDITFEALRAGALTVVHTPGLADPEGCAKLVQAVRLMADVPVVHHWGWEQAPEPTLPAPLQPGDDDHRLQMPRMIGIAASTGGPGALAAILRALPADWSIPILIVQHVSRGFTAGLAEWLDGETPLAVTLANHGSTARPGSVLVAPDDYHLLVTAAGVVELCREPPYRGLRPSANYLFRSLASAFGPRSVGIVLTGMGDDGAEGLQALHAAGGITIAQDQESCVVYGMPCQAVALGAIDYVLSPSEITLTLNRLARLQDRVSSQ